MLPLLFFLLSLLLRLYNLISVPLPGDSGRDLLATHVFLQTHRLPLLGPPTSLGWLHLGPFIYYLWSPLLALSHGNPLILATFSAFLDSLIAPLLILCFTSLIGKRSATLAALFYATSPLIVIWSRIPLHPSLSPIFATLLLATFVLWKRKHTTWLLLSLGLISGLLLQTHLAALILIAILYLLILFSSRHHRLKTTLFLSLSSLITLFPLFAYDSNNDFKMARELALWFPYRLLDTIGFFDTRHLLSIAKVSQFLLQLSPIVQQLIYPYSLTFSLLIFSIFATIFFIKRPLPNWFIRLNLVTIFFALLAFLFFGTIKEHYFTFLFPIVSITVGFTLNQLSRSFNRSLVALIIFVLTLFNISSLVTNNPDPWTNRYGLPLVIQIQIVDSINVASSNHPFSLKPRPDIVNLPTYLDSYRYLLLWRAHKVPVQTAHLTFTIYDIWPYPQFSLPPRSIIHLFPHSAVVTTYAP